MNDLLQAKNNQKDKLIESILKLESFLPDNSYRLKVKLNQIFTNKIDGTCLYVLKTKNLNKEYLRIKYRKLKSIETFKLSSINEIKEFDGTIYVGSSNSLKSRINQHLGNSSEKVYSLHLKNWFGEIDNEIDLEYYIIPKEYSGLANILENGLWDLKKPLFGKKGTNVKSSINL